MGLGGESARWGGGVGGGVGLPWGIDAECCDLLQASRALVGQGEERKEASMALLASQGEERVQGLFGLCLHR